MEGMTGRGFNPNEISGIMRSDIERKPDAMTANRAEDGRKAAITDEDVIKAMHTLRKYQAGKQTLEDRIRENEEWYRQRYWSVIGHSKGSDPEPSSAWLLNALLNKHADAMDNFPEPSVLPREAADKNDAENLSEIIPAILEQCDYEKVYDQKWWRKLKSGTGVTIVRWNPEALNGLGDIEIECVDILKLFWQPGINDIQKSRHLFRVESVERDVLVDKYPVLNDAATGKDVRTTEYIHDDSNPDEAEMVPVVDWYYKKTINGKQIVHLCKFACGKVLYASENEPDMRETGYYAHGKYPFVFDRMFPIEDSPAAFGYLDICKDPQVYIDKLNAVMIKNAIINTKPRYFVRGDGSINENEYADLSRDFVHYNGSGNPADNIMAVPHTDIPPYAMQLLSYKVDELKTTSGNTDFGQGQASSGVTAASAIAAIQEASGKLARDMLKNSYRAHKEECELIIELIRQFYDVQREYRIIGTDGAEKFVEYSNRNIKVGGGMNEYGVTGGERKPIFDIKVRIHKANAFSKLSQNELAKELYSGGFFLPQNADQALTCISMMDFEGKNEIEQRIMKNGTMLQQMQQMQQQMAQMAQIIASLRGSNAAAAMGGAEAQPMPEAQEPGEEQIRESKTKVNPLGDVVTDVTKSARAANAVQAIKGAADPTMRR